MNGRDHGHGQALPHISGTLGDSERLDTVGNQLCTDCHDGTSDGVGGKSAIQVSTHANTGTTTSFVKSESDFELNCIECHDGTEGSGKSKLNLTGDPVDEFTHAYRSLRPYVRWYEWGGQSITQVVTHPGRGGADESPLLRIIRDETHAPHVQLSDDQMQRLNIWLDGNAPFYGTYDEARQTAQRAGQHIQPQTLQ